MSRFKNRKIRVVPITKLIPSFVTLLALCAGMTAIRLAHSDNFQQAILLLLMAAVLDGLDGRIARALRSVSSFGAELDSLCDMVNFGVAPMMVLYYWKLQNLAIFGWLSILFFTTCTAIRLARFNVMLTDDCPIKKAIQKQFFTGMPTPIAAILSVMPLMIFIEYEINIAGLLISLYLFMIAIMMISRVPTFSFKSMTLNKSNVILAIIFMMLIATFIFTEPIKLLLMLCFAYICSIPFGVRKYYSMISKMEAQNLKTSPQ